MPVYFPIENYTKNTEAIVLYREIERNMLRIVCRMVTYKESDVSTFQIPLQIKKKCPLQIRKKNVYIDSLFLQCIYIDYLDRMDA